MSGHIVNKIPGQVENRKNSSLQGALTETSRQRGPGKVGDIQDVNSPVKTGSRQPQTSPGGGLKGVNSFKDLRQTANRVPSGKMAGVNSGVVSRQRGQIPGGTFGNDRKLISAGVNEITSRQQGPGAMGELDNVNPNVRSRQRPGDAETMTTKKPSFYSTLKTTKGVKSR